MINANSAFLLALSALAIALFSAIKALKTPELIEQQGNIILNTLDETLKETLEPVLKNISSSYSHKGTLGAHAKQVKTMDKKIAQDIVNMQDPLIKGALDMFPNVKEYVEKNPNLLLELLPRIQMLQQTQGFKLGDLTGKNPSPSLGTHPHPFGLNEE